MTLLTVDSRNLTGKPTPGMLKISTSRKPIFDTQSKVTFSGEAVEPLGTDGKASVELPPSNGAHTGAVFLYSFEVQLAGFGTWVVRNVLLPDVGTIDLSELHNSTPAPGEPTRVVKVPADGQDGQVLVWDGAGFTWADPPKGDKGDTGDLEFMSGTTRIVNLALGREYATTSYLRQYMSAPIPMAEGDIIYTHRVYSNDEGANHNFTGAIAIHDGSVHTLLADAWRPFSGDRHKSRRVKITSPVPENATISIYGENPASPELFSDINIINLTQVYGSGNEPSLEYMDALVEKHGGYIDGEQHVVGDALHALTLAGQGMGVRVDNSVGTRVFLDYPGGSTMLHGDTGWRNVEDLLDPAFALAAVQGRVRVRRVNNQVFWVVRGRFVEPLPMYTAQNVTTSIPVQFRQSPANYGTLAMGLSFPSRTVFSIENFGSSETLAIRGAETGEWSVDESLAASFSYSTTASWPDTLPGLPV